jgi:hypothetical protein
MSTNTYPGRPTWLRSLVASTSLTLSEMRRLGTLCRRAHRRGEPLRPTDLAVISIVKPAVDRERRVRQATRRATQRNDHVHKLRDMRAA